MYNVCNSLLNSQLIVGVHCWYHLSSIWLCLVRAVLHFRLILSSSCPAEWMELLSFIQSMSCDKKHAVHRDKTLTICQSWKRKREADRYWTFYSIPSGSQSVDNSGSFVLSHRSTSLKFCLRLNKPKKKIFFCRLFFFLFSNTFIDGHLQIIA